MTPDHPIISTQFCCLGILTADVINVANQSENALHDSSSCYFILLICSIFLTLVSLYFFPLSIFVAMRLLGDYMWLLGHCFSHSTEWCPYGRMTIRPLLPQTCPFLRLKKASGNWHFLILLSTVTVKVLFLHYFIPFL